MKNFNFEQALKRLEEITNILESEDLSIDKSLELYEEGIKLKNLCESYIEKAEKKILKISNQQLVEIPEEDIYKNTNLFED